MPKSLPTVALFLLLPTLLSAADAPPNRAKAIWSPEALAALSAPEKIEVFRIAERQLKVGDRPQKIGPYFVIAQAKDPGKEVAQRIAAMLLDDHSYEWELKKGCEPMPGIAFRIHGAGKTAEVVLCYECKMLSPIPDGHWHNFDPAQTALIKFAKELFPDDKEIAGLKE